MCYSTLFHIRLGPNISLEKRTGLWYNQDRKAVLLWQIQNFVIYLQILRLKQSKYVMVLNLVNQSERSSTSIGANIHEANYAHSKADFIAKFQIALKECYETEYWLELFVKSELLDREIAKDLYNQCGTIRRMLIASINTAKENNK